MKTQLNTRIAAAGAKAVTKIVFSVISSVIWLIIFIFDRILHAVPADIPFLPAGLMLVGFVFIFLFLWLLISGISDFSIISAAREIEDKLCVPITAKNFAEIRRNPGLKRLMRDIAGIRKRGLFKGVSILEDCIVFEQPESPRRLASIGPPGFRISFESGAEPMPALMLKADEGMCFSEGGRWLSFSLVIALLATSGVQILLGHNSAAIVGLIIAGVVFVLTIAMGTHVRGIAYKESAAPAPVVIDINPSGDSAADALIQSGHEHLREIGLHDALIRDEKLKANTAEITAVTRQLLDLLSENPKKSGQAGQLVNYALPTIIKLLKQHIDLDRQPVKGENIRKSMDKIVEMSGSVAEIMRRELDALYADRTFDIEVDVEVLQNMMSQDEINLG